HPRTGIQFRHAEGHARPFGGYLVLGARSYVGCTGAREFLAVEAENDWLRRSCRRGASTTTSARAGSRGACTSSARAGSTTTTRCARSERSNLSEPSGAAASANSHAPDVALAHRSVPGGLDLAGVVECDSAVDDDEGIGDTADRAVLVVEYRALIALITIIIVAPPILHRRKIQRLCSASPH